MKIGVFYFLILFLVSFTCFSQENKKEDIFNEFSKKNKALDEIVRMDVSGLTTYELLNSIALEHKINIDVDSDLKTISESSFFDIPVKDVFSFVVKKYNLEVEIMNSIIVFKKPFIKKVISVEKKKRQLEVSFNKKNRFLSVKLKDNFIEEVCEKISDLSGLTILISPKIRGKKVSAYILNRPIEQAIDMIAKSNQMNLVSDDGFFYLEAQGAKKKGKIKEVEKSYEKIKELKTTAEIKVNTDGSLSIKAFDANVMALIAKVAEELNIDYFIYDKPSGLKTTLVAKVVSFDQLLKNIFNGTNYTFKKDGDFYFIGKQDTEGLRKTELIQLENRTIERVLETLPKALLENIEIKEISELNGFIASGSESRIFEIREYIKKIDKVIPMILIEVLIVQYKRSSDVQTGLKAILGEPNKEIVTSGKIFPTTDITLNSGSVNNLIEAFNGFGIFNLGKVTKRFYLNLSALENNSIIDLKSTPKISTLNGHEAKLSIGETSYYFEQNNRLINGGNNTDILQSGHWKSTEANLSVVIKPYVSKDEQITLNITVERSRFLARQGENSPPGKATQQFESLVRCKNGEMILMGGLNEIEKENSGTGTPWLSRVPILKWLFSTKKKSKSKSKLHIFIKPTVVY